MARRFLAIFHPDAVFERTRVETTVAEHVFRTSGRVLLEAGWRSVYGQEADSPDKPEDDSGGDQLLPKLELGEDVETRRVESLRKETQPPRRFTEASLLGAMETAGKDIEDVELREAMKDSGIGTPATRASIIERLIAVEYIDREGRALHATEKGIQVIRLLGEHQLTSPELTGQWERRLELIAQGEESRPSFMNDIARFTRETVEQLDGLKGVKIERANLGPCPVCGKDVNENRKGYSCWSKDDPGCGFVVWKKKAGKNLPASVVKELMAKPEGIDRARRRAAVGPHREAGHGLQGPLRTHVPRQAEDRAGRRGQVARGLRRGMGLERRDPRSGRPKGRPRQSLAASVLDEHSRGRLAHQLLDLLSRRRGHGRRDPLGPGVGPLRFTREVAEIGNCVGMPWTVLAAQRWQWRHSASPPVVGTDSARPAYFVAATVCENARAQTSPREARWSSSCSHSAAARA